MTRDPKGLPDGRAIVIGAGANGLVAAHTLARAGRRVLVLERRPDADRSADSGPDVGWIPPQVVRDLALERHGLQVYRPDPWIVVALPDGGRLELSQDMRKSVEAIRRLSPADASKWPAFCERMRRLAAVLEALYTAPAPDVETRELSELLRLGRLGLRVRRLGRQGMIDLLRILPMSVAELLDEWFEADALKAVLGVGGVMHLRQGPRSGGTAFSLLHHHVGSPAGVFRPPLSNISQVLTGLPGVELRRGAEVARVAVNGGRATGVVLASGEEIAAQLVVSSADPRCTLLDLVEPGWLDPEFVRAVRNIKCRGVAARVRLTLDRAPEFSTLAIAPSLEYLERAYDDAKYGRVSAHPWLEARAEDHRVAVHVQYVPHTLADGAWDDARRRALGETVVELLARHVPAVRQAVTGQEVLTPKDLEDRFGCTEGHRYHGELTLDQILFMRPVPGWSRYRTPIPGLYLCGAGTHPGGGIAG
ncbi:MAG: NAD(P)/FAD-dependent oxidoreductase, partial [Gemmatimonadetes bacterium]|nr:NAD(P)/FAD-dependent oxidoreductase [Gemmatimonadota bacterium]